MGLEAVGSVLKRNRLRWFGHVERKEIEDWVRKWKSMEVEGKMPGKTWLEVVENDMKGLSNPSKCGCMDHRDGRRKIVRFAWDSSQDE